MTIANPAQATSHRFTVCSDAPNVHAAIAFETVAPIPKLPSSAEAHGLTQNTFLIIERPIQMAEWASINETTTAVAVT